MPSVYGPMVATEDVRLWAIDHLETWCPSYLAEVGRERDVTLAPFAGFTTTTDDRFPVCVVACAGTDERPERHGDGKVTAQYTLGVAAVCEGDTRDEATALASWYGLAVRGAFLQHPSMGGHADGCVWDREAIEEVAWDADRSIVACIEQFTVTVPAVIDTTGGVLTPPADPDVSVSTVTVDTTDVTVHPGIDLS